LLSAGAARRVRSDGGLRVNNWSAMIRICAGRKRSSVVALACRTVGGGIAAKAGGSSIAILREVARRIIGLRRTIWRGTIRISVTLSAIASRGIGLCSIAWRSVARRIVARRSLGGRNLGERSRGRGIGR
jgi:hypothetical protein